MNASITLIRGAARRKGTIGVILLRRVKVGPPCIAYDCGRIDLEAAAPHPHRIHPLARFALARDRGASALAQDAGPIKPMDVKPALAELGKRMFYDVRLSGDTTLACASCHRPDKAFTDGEALSAAYTGAAHFRNTPTLANVGYRAATPLSGTV